MVSFMHREEERDAWSGGVLEFDQNTTHRLSIIPKTGCVIIHKLAQSKQTMPTDKCDGVEEEIIMQCAVGSGMDDQEEVTLSESAFSLCRQPIQLHAPHECVIDELQSMD